jgi:transcriptional regulator with XRE-family HTH domain
MVNELNMKHKTDFNLANSEQIAASLGGQLADIRLSQNRTQQQVAGEAGVSRATLARLEQGHGVSLDTFIRVLMALKLQQHLEHFLPNPSIRPLDRVALAGRERQRARPGREDEAEETWLWGDDP